MLQKRIIISLAAFTLLMSGCGSDTTGEDKLAVQQMLDKGDYAGVIENVAPRASSDDDYVNLGTAYLGKAGFSVTDVISALATSDTFGQGEAFANYIKTVVGSDPSPTAFSDLEQSSFYFSKVVGVNCLENNSALLSADTQNICLFMGLALTSKAATTIDLLTDSLASFGSGGLEDPKLKASACAMQYSLAPSEVDAECDVSEKGSVKFLESQKTYKLLGIEVRGITNDFLFTNTNSSVLTVGYCPNDDFSKRDNNQMFGYYPCPINETPNAEDVTTTGVLITTLNDGIDMVKAVATDDIKSNVDEFKCEILGGIYSSYSGCSNSGEIDEKVVIDFLNKNN